MEFCADMFICDSRKYSTFCAGKLIENKSVEIFLYKIVIYITHVDEIRYNMMFFNSSQSNIRVNYKMALFNVRSSIKIL